MRLLRFVLPFFHTPFNVWRLTRRFMPLLLLLAIADTARAQNLVIIKIDDIGITSMQGQPNFIRITNLSTAFSTHYAYPICTPSRAAIMTGRLPHRSGSQALFGNLSMKGMAVAEVTLADLLRPLGYHTALLGKWHLGELLIYMPSANGFDFSYWIPISVDNIQPLRFYTNDVLTTSVVKNSAAGKALLKRITIDQRDQALSYLENAEEPFYLDVNFSMFHAPHQCFAKQAKETTDACALRELDQAVGAIFDLVRDRWPNTYILIAGDNGATSPTGNGGLRGDKSSAFEGGSRTPALLSGPDVPAQTIDDPAAIWDWLPTFAGLLGATVPSDRTIDGRDLWPLIQGAGPRGDGHFLGWWTLALRDGCDKLVLKGNGVPADLLFDLCVDPNETTPIVDPVLLASMKAKHKAMTPKKGL